MMISRYLLGIGFQLFALLAWAQTIEITVKEDAVTPYLNYSHQCDWSAVRRLPDGILEAPIKESATIYLAVNKAQYEEIMNEFGLKLLDYLQRDQDLKAMENKIKEFERAGNIPAMEHWKSKQANAIIFKQSYLKNTEILSFIRQETARPDLPRYHTGTYSTKRYSTFDELRADPGSACRP